MHYAIYSEDVEDSLELRRSVRAAHLARLEALKNQNRLLIAGPMMASDSDDPFISGFKGSLVIAEFDSLEDAKAWATADPYVTANVYKRITVNPFKKVLP